MADGGGDADFTLRLKQDVAGPAAAAKKALKDLGGGFDALGSKADRAQAKIDAAWKKQMAAAKAAMAKEHAASKQKGLAADARAMKQQLAMAKQIAKEKKQADLAAGKQAARNASLADRAKKDARQAEIAAGKQAARNANLADKAKIHSQEMHLRGHEIKHARAGGFDAGEAAGGLALGAEAAIVAGAAAAAVAVGYLGYEFLKAAEEASEFQQSSIKAIGYLTDNAPAAEGVFDDVRKSAQELGLDVHDTTAAFQKLLVAQYDVGQAKELIKMSADLQAVGASAEQVQHVLFAMAEIKDLGVFQKRQERMLLMAGVSGQKLDEALMRRMGIKTKGGLDVARKKNKIGADVATEAIKDAVMAQSHEDHLGQRGQQTADTTIKGLKGEGNAGYENFFIDIGKKIDPVLTALAVHAKDLLVKIVNDPQLAQLGEFLLVKWERFGAWIDTNWPRIEDIVITGLHAVTEAVQDGFKVWDFAVDHWSEAKLALEGLAVVFGVLEAAGFILMAPFLAGLAIVGALTIGIAMLVGYIAECVPTIYTEAKSIGVSFYQGFADGITDGLNVIDAAAGLLGQRAGDAAARAIKAHSPSELTYDLGGNFGEGFALGMDDSQPQVKGSAVSLAGASLDSLGGASGGAASSGGGKPEVHLHVSCEGGATQEDGERFGAGIMAKIDARIYSLLDELDPDPDGTPA